MQAFLSCEHRTHTSPSNLHFRFVPTSIITRTQHLYTCILDVFPAILQNATRSLKQSQESATNTYCQNRCDSSTVTPSLGSRTVGYRSGGKHGPSQAKPKQKPSVYKLGSPRSCCLHGLLSSPATPTTRHEYTAYR
jgi:hypothetical protein